MYEAALAAEKKKLADAVEQLEKLKKEAAEFIRDNQGDICSGMMQELRETFVPHGVKIPGPEGYIRIKLEIVLNSEDDTFPSGVSLASDRYSRNILAPEVETALVELTDADALAERFKTNTQLTELIGEYTVEIEEATFEFWEC